LDIRSQLSTQKSAILYKKKLSKKFYLPKKRTKVTVKSVKNLPHWALTYCIVIEVTSIVPPEHSTQVEKKVVHKREYKHL